jgi:hypothetical protein
MPAIAPVSPKADTDGALGGSVGALRRNLVGEAAGAGVGDAERRLVRSADRAVQDMWNVIPVPGFRFLRAINVGLVPARVTEDEEHGGIHRVSRESTQRQAQ